MHTNIEKLIDMASETSSWSSPIVIYGAGNKGREVCRLLLAQGHAVAGFIDSHAKPGQFCEGLPVQTADEWRLANRPQTHTVVVAIHNYAVDMQALLHSIDSMGFMRVVNMVEFYNQFPGGLPHHYWLCPRAFYLPYKAEIQSLFEIIKDEASLRLLQAILAFRLSGDYTVLPQPSQEDQYRPTGLPRWPEPLRFVDCGAFVGDTIEQFAEEGYRFEAILAFEPDVENYQALVKTAHRFGFSICIPCGVSGKMEQVRFLSGGGGSSHIAKEGEGNVIVQCVSLDEAIGGFCPGFIKMDIEGAEIDALHGAYRLISEHRPGLAISVYHHPAHLWQIPLLIASWNLGYQFYLRMHGHSTFDVVLYAIAE